MGKTGWVWGLAFCVLCGGGHLVKAAEPKVAITATPKRESGEKKSSGDVTREETICRYTVKLANGAFAPASGISAQYRVFVRDDSGIAATTRQALKRYAFTTAVPDLAPGDTFSFVTEPVKLEKSTLAAGCHYRSGKRWQTADRVIGIWIRVLQGDKIIGEYINPTTIASKEKF